MAIIIFQIILRINERQLDRHADSVANGLNFIGGYSHENLKTVWQIIGQGLLQKSETSNLNNSFHFGR